MRFDTARDVCGNAGIESSIPAFHDVKIPRHIIVGEFDELSEAKADISGLRSYALNSIPCSISDDRLWV
jgi:hypothetical protein